MDQVILVLDESIGLFGDDGKERVVTSTMINNYVKHKLIDPPEKKKYDRSHLALLVVVSVMKRVLSMSEITVMVDMMTEAYGIEAAYDLFCRRLEETLVAVFGGGGARFDPDAGSEADAVLGAALTALGGKLYLQYCLAKHAPAQEAPEAAKEKKTKERNKEKAKA